MITVIASVMRVSTGTSLTYYWSMNRSEYSTDTVARELLRLFPGWLVVGWRVMGSNIERQEPLV
jgi:hypothetical protein